MGRAEGLGRVADGRVLIFVACCCGLSLGRGPGCILTKCRVQLSSLKPMYDERWCATTSRRALVR
jgi:hypothetical protein